MVNHRSPAVFLAAVVLLTSYLGLSSDVGSENPFSLFKLNGAESPCLVKQLADKGNALRGRNRVGADGGTIISCEEAQKAYTCLR